VVCLPCYDRLDKVSVDGTAEIGAQTFDIAGHSRGDKAAVVTDEKWRAFQQNEARRLGLDT
jgi:hypothetical protein